MFGDFCPATVSRDVNASGDARGDVHVCGTCHTMMASMSAFVEHRTSGCRNASALSWQNLQHVVPDFSADEQYDQTLFRGCSTSSTVQLADVPLPPATTHLPPPPPSAPVPSPEPPRLAPVSPRAPKSSSRPKLHLCSVCGYRCIYAKDLRRHMYSHGDEKFPCGQCSSVFSRPHKLAAHQRVKHSGDQPVALQPCPVSGCGRMLKPGCPTKKHVQNCHSDIRPFSCQICDYRAKSSHRLDVHLRTHTGDTPFCCDICGKNFATMSDLSRHKAVHSGSKPHQCQFCSFNTAYIANLRVHIRRRHPEMSDVHIESDHTQTKDTSESKKSRSAPAGRVRYLPNFHCNQCNASFVRQEAFNIHSSSAHGRDQQKSDDL